MAILGMLGAGLVTARSQDGPPTAPPAIRATSAILVDALNGQVLFEKNADARRPPASTTKILTAILLIENVEPDTLIQADKAVSETEGSSLYMLPGEKIAARELVYALLMRSANDACVAVARHIAGSEAAFAEMMNAKAAEIGATNSHFSNPNGLHAPDHYSTARDLAAIARYAVQLPAFNEAARTRYHTIVRDPRNKDTFLKHRAKWLWHYPGADGIKTGYTVPAGRCFVGSATRNGWRLISVVLNSPDIFGETRALMDYGFAAYEPLSPAETRGYMAQAPVSEGVRGAVAAAPSREIRVVWRKGQKPQVHAVPKWSRVVAPVAAGTAVGELVVTVSDQVVDRVPLIARSDVPRRPSPPPPGPLWPRATACVLALAVFWYGSAHSKNPRLIGRRLAPRV